jgi:hypothetical protein
LALQLTSGRFRKRLSGENDLSNGSEVAESSKNTTRVGAGGANVDQDYIRLQTVEGYYQIANVVHCAYQQKVRRGAKNALDQHVRHSRSAAPIKTLKRQELAPVFGISALPPLASRETS